MRKEKPFKEPIKRSTAFETKYKKAYLKTSNINSFLFCSFCDFEISTGSLTIHLRNDDEGPILAQKQPAESNCFSSSLCMDTMSYGKLLLPAARYSGQGNPQPHVGVFFPFSPCFSRSLSHSHFPGLRCLIFSGERWK